MPRQRDIVQISINKALISRIDSLVPEGMTRTGWISSVLDQAVIDRAINLRNATQEPAGVLY